MTQNANGLSRTLAWGLALTATFTMAVSYFDRQALAVLSPVVTRELHFTDEQYGWLLSAFSGAYLVGSPAAGWLIDRVGARRGLLGAVLLWSIVAALHALAPTYGVLFGLRIALGLTESPSFPGAAQIIHRAVPPTDQARAFGILFTGSSFGAMAAPPVAIFLESRYGFRIAFLGTAVVGLIWVPVWLAIAWHPDARRALDSHKPEAPATAITAPKPGEKAPKTIELLANPAVIRTIAVVLASAPILSFGLNWSPKFLTATYGATMAEIGMYLIIPPLLFDLGAVAFGHFASRRMKQGGFDGSPPRLLLALAGLLGTLTILIPFAGSPLGSTLVAAFALAGGGGVFALMTSDMLGRIHPSTVASASGISAAAQSLAYIVANPLIGWSVDRTKSYTPILIALALWVIPGTALWIFCKPPPLWERRAEDRPPG
ncbi:MAG: MFS transporter [Polyangiaceae bacterium]|nr:MFS transporter [Polyangiaceae bacterium]